MPVCGPGKFLYGPTNRCRLTPGERKKRQAAKKASKPASDGKVKSHCRKTPSNKGNCGTVNGVAKRHTTSHTGKMYVKGHSRK